MTTGPYTQRFKRSLRGKIITGFRRLRVFYHVKIHMAVCAPCSHISSHIKRFPIDYLKNT